MSRATSSRATRSRRSSRLSQTLKEALDGTDVERIKNATEALMTASHGFSQRLYEQATQSSGSGAAAAVRTVTAPQTRPRTTRSSMRRSWMSRVRDHAVERLTPQRRRAGTR